MPRRPPGTGPVLVTEGVPPLRAAAAADAAVSGGAPGTDAATKDVRDGVVGQDSVVRAPNGAACEHCDGAVTYDPSCCLQCLQQRHKVAILGMSTRHAAILKQKDAGLQEKKEELASMKAHMVAKDERLRQLERLLDHWRDVRAAPR